jgi:hypothetical protein
LRGLNRATPLALLPSPQQPEQPDTRQKREARGGFWQVDEHAHVVGEFVGGDEIGEAVAWNAEKL